MADFQGAVSALVNEPGLGNKSTTVMDSLPLGNSTRGAVSALVYEPELGNKSTTVMVSLPLGEAAQGSSTPVTGHGLAGSTVSYSSALLQAGPVGRSRCTGSMSRSGVSNLASQGLSRSRLCKQVVA